MKIGIIGAGIAGLSCADALVARGHEIEVYDKGRGPGGRMSTRRVETRLGEVSFDHGAQYFSVRDPGFGSLVQQWVDKGLAKPWPIAGKDTWVGVPSMSAVMKDMSNRHTVTFGQLVKGLVRQEQAWHFMMESVMHGPFDAVVIAVPAEQAAPFLALHDFSMASQALHARSQPCWTAMFAFAEPLPIEDSIIRDTGPIAWAARNNNKAGRTGPEAWVVQATAKWSTAHLEEQSEFIYPLLQDALQAAVGVPIPEPIYATAHRWRFALSAGIGAGALWNPQIGLGVCGDWLLGPRVECAWLSGQTLAAAINKDSAEEIQQNSLEFLAK